MLNFKKILAIFFATLTTMVISTGCYMLITKVSPVIEQDYKNASIFFQGVNPRDAIYIINPLIISLSTFLLWIFTNKTMMENFSKKIITITIFSSLYALLIAPILLFNYASLKISFFTIFGWFIQFYIQAFVAGIIFSFLIKKE